MRPVCLLNRTKNLHQSDGLHFISDSYKKCALIILQERVNYYHLFDKYVNFYYDSIKYEKEEHSL